MPRRQCLGHQREGGGREAGGGQPLPGSFGDPLALELGDRGEDVEHQPPGRGGGVDVLGQGPEARACLPNPGDDPEKVLKRAAEAVVLGHDHNVAGAQLVDQPLEFWPGSARAGDLLGKDPPRARGLKGRQLSVEVLVLGRDTRIAEDHAQTLHQPAGFRQGVAARSRM